MKSPQEIRATVDAHRQVYRSSCSPSLVEIILKKTVAPAGPVTFEAIARDLPGNPARLTQTWKPAVMYVPPTVGAAPATPESGPAIAPTVMVSDPAVLDFDPRAG